MQIQDQTHSKRNTRTFLANSWLNNIIFNQNLTWSPHFYTMATKWPIQSKIIWLRSLRLTQNLTMPSTCSFHLIWFNQWVWSDYSLSLEIQAIPMASVLSFGVDLSSHMTLFGQIARWICNYFVFTSPPIND